MSRHPSPTPSSPTNSQGFRYCRFTCFGRYGRGFLRISGQRTEPLPQWLSIPYLVVSEYDQYQLTPEHVANRKVEYGDGLCNQTGSLRGTVGAIMSSSLPRGRGTVHAILTAGHVIPFMTKEMYVAGRRQVAVQVSNTSKRRISGKINALSDHGHQRWHS